jgi:hypothetical protein
MQYNEEQLYAIDTITAFILNDMIIHPKEDYFIVLEGYAGTGKSTVVKEILRNIRNKKKAVVSAPTHRAKEVIQNFTKENAETIQSLLGLRPDTDLASFDPNKPQFNPIAEEKISNYKVLIIDEASMISKHLKQTIEEKAIEYKVKVVYIGDIYQLPPIGEVESGVFKHKHKVRLNTIVRQTDGNPNGQIIELARNDIKEGKDSLHFYLTDVPHNINEQLSQGYTVLGKDAFYKKILEYYLDSEYKYNRYLIRTFAWTNNVVDGINLYIRKHLINSNELVAAGDFLTGYKTISKEIKTPPFLISTVRNSVDYEVTSAYITTQHIKGVDLKGYNVSFADTEQRNMFILHPDSYQTFIEKYVDLLYDAQTSRRWKAFYDFKNEIVLMETIKYGSGPREKVDKDIGHGYALTVHKSQGTTVKHAAVVLNNIRRNPTAKERRQLTYVALSRCTDSNIIYGQS